MVFKLAVLQLSLYSDPDLNLGKVLRLTESLSGKSVLLLPEMFFCGFDYDRMDEFAGASQYVLGTLAELSKEKDLLIVGTLPKRTQDGVQNVAFLIENGKLIGERAKAKLFSPFDEDKHFVPGKGSPVFDTGFGRVGVLICFELRFTDMVLELKRGNIDILLIPAQWGYARREHLKILSRARAIELQSYVAVSDTWGEFKGTRFAGQSGIYSPWGEILAFSESGDVLLVSEVDLRKVSEARKAIPMD